MGYKTSQDVLHGVPNIPGNLAPILLDLELEGESEFPEEIPHLTGKWYGGSPVCE